MKTLRNQFLQLLIETSPSQFWLLPKKAVNNFPAQQNY